MDSEALPPGWAWAQVGDLCELINGRAFKPTDWQDFGLPIIRIQNLNNSGAPFNRYSGSVAERHKVTDGDLLFAWSGTPGTSFGAHIWKRGEAILNQHIFQVLYDKARVDRDYFCHAINYSLAGIIAQAHGGAGLAHITKGRFEETQIPIPSLVAQVGIARAISEAFEELHEAEAALARAKAGVEQFRASLLHAACTGQLTAAWRQANPPTETGADLLRRILAERRATWERTERARLEARGTPPKGDAWKARYVEPAAPDSSGLPELPNGWVWSSLPQLGDFGRGKSKHRPRGDDRLYGNAIPFIQTGDISRSDGRIRTYSQSYSHFGIAQSRIWPKGTVCITIAANIAASGILDFDSCFPDSVVGLTCADEDTTRFVELFIRTARENLEQYAPATAQKNINLEILSSLAVPLPPAQERHQIVERVADMMAAVTIDLCGEISPLRQSILHAAFTGRLVPQNPDDEPAETLLARLRATTAPARRTRRRTPAEACA